MAASMLAGRRSLRLVTISCPEAWSENLMSFLAKDA